MAWGVLADAASLRRPSTPTREQTLKARLPETRVLPVLHAFVRIIGFHLASDGVADKADLVHRLLRRWICPH